MYIIARSSTQSFVVVYPLRRSQRSFIGSCLAHATARNWGHFSFCMSHFHLCHPPPDANAHRENTSKVRSATIAETLPSMHQGSCGPQFDNDGHWWPEEASSSTHSRGSIFDASWSCIACFKFGGAFNALLQANFCQEWVLCCGTWSALYRRHLL